MLHRACYLFYYTNFYDSFQPRSPFFVAKNPGGNLLKYTKFSFTFAKYSRLLL